MASPGEEFTTAQRSEIILQYGKTGSATSVRRWFRKQYPDIPKSRIPSVKKFWRLIQRFKATGSTDKRHNGGGKNDKPPTMTEENIELIRQMIEDDNSLSINRIAREVGIDRKTVWLILRKKLKLYPYKQHDVLNLNDRKKEARVEFCTWVLEQLANDPDFLQMVLFSDEKKFEERTRPNKQNERYWGMVDPLVMDKNRVQGGRSLMCWTGLINGQVIIHWFEEKTTVNQHNYLEMLKEIVWPKIRGVARARGYWFQQDGAPPHTTQMVRDWLESKFGDRVISNKTDRPWPPGSPDMSPLDFYFWGRSEAELRRCPPSSMEELKETVTDFALSLSPEEIRKAVNHVKVRAEACLSQNGDNFEHLLKKRRRDVEE